MKVSRSFYSWTITLFGSILLLNIAVRFWRHADQFGRWDYLEWGLNVALVVAIWFAYRRQLRDLDKLTEQVDEKALVRLSAYPYGITLLAYVFLLQWLTNMRRH